MASTNTNEENLDKTINLAIAGKLSLERFKKVMPQSYAALGPHGDFDSAFAVSLFNRIWSVVKSKLLQYPELMAEKMQCYNKHGTLQEVLIFTTFIVAMKTDRRYEVPYLQELLRAFSKQLKRSHEMFAPTNSNNRQTGDYEDNLILGEVYFRAYCATVHQFQDEIENYHATTTDQVFTYINNRDGFVQDIIGFLDHGCVALPSQISTKNVEMFKI
jgi:hypothetical protein